MTDLAHTNFEPANLDLILAIIVDIIFNGFTWDGTGKDG